MAMCITSICPVKPISEHRDRLHWNVVEPLMINLCNTSHLRIDCTAEVKLKVWEVWGVASVEPTDITLDAVD